MSQGEPRCLGELHEWITPMIQMPEGYLKPSGPPFCGRCPAVKMDPASAITTTFNAQFDFVKELEAVRAERDSAEASALHIQKELNAAEDALLAVNAAIRRALSFHQTTHIHAVLEAALRGDAAAVEAKGTGGRVRPTLGTCVKWTSQAGGQAYEKFGKVVEVVAANRKPDRQRFLSLHRGQGCGASRDHESYVVDVVSSQRVQGVCEPTFYRTSRIYWPRASALHIVQLEESN